MTTRFAQRLLGLCAVALVAALVAVAITRDRSNASSPALPVAAPAPGGGWFKAIAVPARPVAQPRATSCGYRLTSKTLGVAHPVLPCGAQVYLQFGNTQLLTRVIGRGTGRAAEFALTQALADKIGLHSRQTITWRFAVAPSS